MSSFKPSCQVCCEAYGQTGDRKPVSMQPCGHGVCLDCATKLAARRQPCPWRCGPIKTFAINFALMELLEPQAPSPMSSPSSSAPAAKDVSAGHTMRRASFSSSSDSCSTPPPDMRCISASAASMQGPAQNAITATTTTTTTTFTFTPGMTPPLEDHADSDITASLTVPSKHARKHTLPPSQSPASTTHSRHSRPSSVQTPPITDTTTCTSTMWTATTNSAITSSSSSEDERHKNPAEPATATFTRPHLTHAFENVFTTAPTTTTASTSTAKPREGKSNPSHTKAAAPPPLQLPSESAEGEVTLQPNPSPNPRSYPKPSPRHAALQPVSTWLQEVATSPRQRSKQALKLIEWARPELEKLTDSRWKTLTAAFHKLDVDGDGIISEDEWVKYLEKRGHNPDGHQFAQQWKQMDHNGDGGVDFLEYLVIKILHKLRPTTLCCDKCNVPIVDDYLYACQTCWLELLDRGGRLRSGYCCTECFDRQTLDTLPLHQHDLVLIRNDSMFPTWEGWAFSAQLRSEFFGATSSSVGAAFSLEASSSGAGATRFKGSDRGAGSSSCGGDGGVMKAFKLESISDYKGSSSKQVDGGSTSSSSKQVVDGGSSTSTSSKQVVDGGSSTTTRSKHVAVVDGGSGSKSKGLSRADRVSSGGGSSSSSSKHKADRSSSASKHEVVDGGSRSKSKVSSKADAASTSTSKHQTDSSSSGSSKLVGSTKDSGASSSAPTTTTTATTTVAKPASIFKRLAKKLTESVLEGKEVSATSSTATPESKGRSKDTVQPTAKSAAKASRSQASSSTTLPASRDSETGKTTSLDSTTGKKPIAQTSATNSNTSTSTGATGTTSTSDMQEVTSTRAGNAASAGVGDKAGKRPWWKFLKAP